jgi:rhodanese-related sulfurtransferase
MLAKLLSNAGMALLLALVQVCLVHAQTHDVSRLTIEELKAMLQQPDLVVVDVRTVSDWKKSDLKISGAQREDPLDVDSWAGNYAKTKTIVLYCA